VISRIPNTGGEPLRKVAILGVKAAESLRSGQAAPEVT
jgi:hypothetical protein